MKNTLVRAALAVSSLALITACSADDNTSDTPEQATWPESLNALGDGYPNSGDSCMRIGESAATVDFLDDSATLVGCLSAEDADALGGEVVATIDGVTLVSIPAGDSMTGAGSEEMSADAPPMASTEAIVAPTSTLIPLLNATCPGDIDVHADAGGPIYINGAEGSLRKFSDQYFEASSDGVTISLQINPDGSPRVTYTGPGGANGLCTIS